MNGIEYSSVMKISAPHIKAILLWTAVLMCLPSRAALAAGSVTAPEPVASLVSRGAAPGHGTVSWSPDGVRLAYIEGKRLVILDVEAGKRVKSPVKGVYFIRWMDDSRILALRRDKKQAMASLLDASGKTVEEATLPVEADEAYPLRGFERLLLTRTTLETLTIGIETVSTAGVLNTSNGTYGKSFVAERIHPRGLAGREFIMGWSEAGPSPLDDALLLIDYKDPPALSPYVRAIAVDLGTREGRAFYRAPMNMLLPGAGWSSEGRYIAIPELDGSLMIIGRNGDTRVPETDIRGRQAAWSPVSDRICFGGHIISPDGGSPLKLMDEGVDARCYWRPGGRDVALLMGERLELVRGADTPQAEDEGRPAEAAEILEKVRLLRALFDEGFVERRDYEMRLQRLTGIETVEVSR